MSFDPNPRPKPNLNKPNKLLDTIILLAYNVRYGWQGISYLHALFVNTFHHFMILYLGTYVCIVAELLYI